MKSLLVVLDYIERGNLEYIDEGYRLLEVYRMNGWISFTVYEMYVKYLKDKFGEDDE